MHLRGHRAETAQLDQERGRVGADLLQRELPAAGGLREEALGDAQRGRERAALVLIPALQRGDMRESLTGEETQHLQLGVDPGLQPAKHLEHRLVAEHDRGVGLLDAHRAGRRIEVQRAAVLGLGEADAPLAGVDRRLGVDVAQQLAHQLGVGHRVHRHPLRGARHRRARLIAGRATRRPAAADTGRGCRWRSAPATSASSSGGSSVSATALLHLEARDAARFGRIPPLRLQPCRHGLRSSLPSRASTGLSTGWVIRSPPHLPAQAETRRSRGARASGGN